jgi:hypothetical protein
MICNIVISAQSFGLPYLSAYLDSLGTNFSHGANFATSASTIRPPPSIIPQGGFSPFYLDVQYTQFRDFKPRTQFIRQQGTRKTYINLIFTHIFRWSLIMKTWFTLVLFLFFFVGGLFASLMPKEEYFSKALYTFDIGQNDLGAGFFGNMTIQQVNASVPEIINSFSKNIKVVQYPF